MGTDCGPLQIERIRASLHTRRIGRRIEYLLETTSSNDAAWQYADDADADGLVVFTEFQSEGRGRFGRIWSSPRGASVLCSTLLLENDDRLSGNILGLIAPLAVRDAVMSCTEIVPAIRWPNDLYVGHRKLAGILIESRVRVQGGRAFVMGIGINCLQQPRHLEPSPGPDATSLEIECHGRIDRTALALTLIEQLDGWLGVPPTWNERSLRDRWLAGARPLGCRVILRQLGRVFEGTIIDFDPHAGMTLQLDHGGIRVFDPAETTVLSWEPVSAQDQET